MQLRHGLGGDQSQVRTDHDGAGGRSRGSDARDVRDAGVGVVPERGEEVPLPTPEQYQGPVYESCEEAEDAGEDRVQGTRDDQYASLLGFI